MRGPVIIGLSALSLVAACCCPPAPPGTTGSAYGSQGASLRFEVLGYEPDGLDGRWCKARVQATATSAISRFTLVSAYAEDAAGTVVDTSNESITSLAAGQAQILAFNFTRARRPSIQRVRVESR